MKLTEHVQEKLQKLYDYCITNVTNVYNIFEEFFTPEEVDLQNCCSFESFKGTIMNLDLTTIYHGERPDWIEYDIWKNIKYIPLKTVVEPIQLNVLEGYQNLIPKLSVPFILIHFPHVRVTNENGNYVDINHLYAKVRVTYYGTCPRDSDFSLCRAEYSVLHFINGYMHSHVSTINRNNLGEFKPPCLGEGPIKHTLDSLRENYSEDLWYLFCVELAKYVTVESIAGIPYKYLEKLHYSDVILGERGYRQFLNLNICGYTTIVQRKDWADFIKYLANSKKLRYSFLNGSYTIGMTFIEFIITISNEFISWYNSLYNKGTLSSTYERMINNNFLYKCNIDNNKIYPENVSNTYANIKDFNGERLFIFKGKEIFLSIPDLQELEEHATCTLLNPAMAMYLLNLILKVINYRYESKKQIKDEGTITDYSTDNTVISDTSDTTDRGSQDTHKAPVKYI